MAYLVLLLLLAEAAALAGAGMAVVFFSALLGAAAAAALGASAGLTQLPLAEQDLDGSFLEVVAVVFWPLDPVEQFALVGLLAVIFQNSVLLFPTMVKLSEQRLRDNKEVSQPINKCKATRRAISGAEEAFVDPEKPSLHSTYFGVHGVRFRKIVRSSKRAEAHRS